MLFLLGVLFLSTLIILPSYDTNPDIRHNRFHTASHSVWKPKI